jgi:hypothetical protein
LIGAADNLVERIPQRTLLVNQPFRVSHDVDGQDVANLEVDLFLDLSGHL